MIFIPRVVTISRGTSYIDDQIILFKGDRNVEVQITLKNNPFKSKDGSSASCAQLIIDREAGPLFSEISQISNNRISFVVTGEMIDDFEELGDYNFQIVLFNQDQTSRVTLPIVYAGIIIKEPLYEETIAGRTFANNERAVLLASNDPEEVFDDNGDYNRTNWNSGDIITDTKLNKIEEALFMINNDVPTDYATEEYVDNQRRQIETYAEIYTNNAVAQINTNNFATYTYVDNEINKLDIDNYASKEYVDDAVSNISGGGGNVDLTDYATKAYVNEYVANNKPNLEGFATEQYVIDYTSDALGKYATKSYVDKAVANVSGGSGGNNLDIITIGDKDNIYYFTGDEFSSKDYDNEVEKTVLLVNVYIDNMFYMNELVHMHLSANGDDNRLISVYSPCGRVDQYIITVDGKGSIITLNGQYHYAANETLDKKLSNYATKEELNAALGNIESLLGKI